jgi:hypothetical protein
MLIKAEKIYGRKNCGRRVGGRGDPILRVFCLERI